MTTRLEHDYIGLSQTVSSMEKSSDKSSTNNGGLNLKATELRLGLPGSESPERGDTAATLSLHKISSSISGAKRGFSDAIIGASSKWGFSGNGGSESAHDLGKNGGGLFSQRGGVNEGKTAAQQQLGSEVKKDGGVSHPSTKSILHDKKPQNSAPASKAQVVGWPPIRSFRKNSMAPHSPKDNDEADNKVGPGCLYVKVSMDGAPYLRKVDLKTYGSYVKLSSALEKMFSCFTIGQCGSPECSSREGLNENWLMDLLHGSEYVLTYEDKDSDWMLVGDVPWEMFIDSCKRMRIMKSSEAVGLAPRAMEKCKNRN